MRLTIGQLAASANVGVETVRYYQRRGLMAQPARGSEGGSIRRYGADDCQRLRFIRAAQAAGFTLAQIANLLALEAVDDRARVRALAREQVDALDARIAELARTRAALARLAEDCAASDVGPCPILTAFEAA